MNDDHHLTTTTHGGRRHAVAAPIDVDTARGTFVLRRCAVGDRALTLERIEIRANGKVDATYGSGHTYEYASLREVLHSHRLSFLHLERVR